MIAMPTPACSWTKPKAFARNSRMPSTVPAICVNMPTLVHPKSPSLSSWSSGTPALENMA